MSVDISLHIADCHVRLSELKQRFCAGDVLLGLLGECACIAFYPLVNSHSYRKWTNITIDLPIQDGDFP